VFHPLPLESFTSHFEQHPDNPVQVAVLNTNMQEHYRPNMIIDDDNQITDYRADNYDHQHGVIETGVLLVRDSLLPEIKDSADIDLATDLYPVLIKQNRLGGYIADAVFFDIGTPEDYYRFCSYVEKGRARPLMRKTS
jgi:NDP-sugar pyrophosphorylase family protein